MTASKSKDGRCAWMMEWGGPCLRRADDYYHLSRSGRPLRWTKWNWDRHHAFVPPKEEP